MVPKNLDTEAAVALFMESVRNDATFNGFTARDCTRWIEYVFDVRFDNNTVRARLDDMYWNGDAVRGINPEKKSERIYYPAKLDRIG